MNVIVFTICGSVGFILLAIASACIIRRQKYPNVKKLNGLIEPRTTVALKYNNGKSPGGLKNSPSSLPSPLTSDSSSSSPMLSTRPLIVSPQQQSFNRISPSQLGSDRGFINFTLNYSIENETLQVNIICCRDLPELVITSDGQCLLEPYVKLQLLPEKQHRVKTRLVRASRNPQYDEAFSMYGIHTSQLVTTSLHFAVRLFLIQI
ncbi:unnamed protein product [Thelazia callipaeda]|uniref:C2 domain-containing protein n=1 Tax=Thelazia callipaeda TaxID=103827 RepID=A0A0N5CM59_THECL|nr:unnamed protein product [Thelazia callipaeda]